MSGRIFEDENGTFGGIAEYVYSNPAGIFFELVDATNANVIAGRGTGKTTKLIARRTQRVGKSMPGAYFAFVGDFYSNLLSNTVPSMIKGWNDDGMVEGKHYVINEAPPKNWDKPYKKPISYKHTISWKNGCFFKLASMDVVSSMAGDSYQHIFGDEVKYLVKEKLDKLLPANRGEKLTFGGSPYYLGTTFTTDMPNALSANEYDWILDQEQNMNVEQIELILKTSITVNEIKMAMMKAYVRKDRNEFEKQKRNYHRWNQRLTKVRHNSTLFFVISSFANADILELSWFQKQLDLLGIEQFKSSILSMKQEIKQGEKFYPRLENHHFYDDGMLIIELDNYGIGDKPEITSRSLKYINHNRKLEGGADFGNMMSLVIGQPQLNAQRILKNIYTLPPQNEYNLAEKFCRFFKFHNYKTLDLYYDRSGNQYKKIGKDFATSFKNHVENMELDGIKQSWKVNLMSEGQSTIFQQQEFIVVNQILSEQNPKLPRVLIDAFQCRELKSSLQLTKQIIKTDKEGSKSIHKDKTSEKLALSKLPEQSTNLSDALKYYLCRPRYMQLVQTPNASSYAYAPMIH